jgi:hypothetical protein
MNKGGVSFRFTLVIVCICALGVKLIYPHSPDTNFVGVWIDGNIDIMNGIEIDVDQVLRVRGIGKAVGTLRSGGEKEKVAGADTPFPIRRFQNTMSFQDKEGFFVFVVVMVRICGFMGWDLIYTDHCIFRSAVGNHFFAEVFKWLLFLLMGGRKCIYGEVLNFGHTITPSSQRSNNGSFLVKKQRLSEVSAL